MTIRCDEPMKRSKENCYTTWGKRWRCTMQCNDCICALVKQEDGTWKHIYHRAHTKKENNND